MIKKERKKQWVICCFSFASAWGNTTYLTVFPYAPFFFIHSRVFTVLYLSLSVSTVYILLACLLSFVSVCVLPRSTVEGTLTTRFTYVLVSHLKKKKEKKKMREKEQSCLSFFFFCVCVCIVSRTESFTVLMTLVRVTRLKPRGGGFPHYALIKETLFFFFSTFYCLDDASPFKLPAREMAVWPFSCYLWFSSLLAFFHFCTTTTTTTKKKNSLSYYSLCSSNILFFFLFWFTVHDAFFFFFFFYERADAQFVDAVIVHKQRVLCTFFFFVFCFTFLVSDF